jgi:hypothetical protein
MHMAQRAHVSMAWLGWRKNLHTCFTRTDTSEWELRWKIRYAVHIGWRNQTKEALTCIDMICTIFLDS